MSTGSPTYPKWEGIQAKSKRLLTPFKQHISWFPKRRVLQSMEVLKTSYSPGHVGVCVCVCVLLVVRTITFGDASIFKYYKDMQASMAFTAEQLTAVCCVFVACHWNSLALAWYHCLCSTMLRFVVTCQNMFNPLYDIFAVVSVWCLVHILWAGAKCLSEATAQIHISSKEGAASD